MQADYVIVGAGDSIGWRKQTCGGRRRMLTYSVSLVAPMIKALARQRLAA